MNECLWEAYCSAGHLGIERLINSVQLYVKILDSLSTEVRG